MMKSQPVSPDVRTRILETAWRLIGERNDASISLLDVAREAGVSRQTVYVNFRSRAGLLLAMVQHRDATADELGRMKRGADNPAAKDALQAFIKGWFKYVPVVFHVSRALQAAAVSDHDAKLAWNSRMDLLRAGVQGLMQRLRAEGLLAKGWTTEAATDWCYHLIHVDSWQHLVVERNWTPAEVAQRTWETIDAMLIR